MNRRTFLKRLRGIVLGLPFIGSFGDTSYIKKEVIPTDRIDSTFEIINCDLTVLEPNLVFYHDHTFPLLTHQMSPDAHTHTFPEWNNK